MLIYYVIIKHNHISRKKRAQARFYACTVFADMGILRSTLFGLRKIMGDKKLLAGLDDPGITQFLFHPRPQLPGPLPDGAVDFSIPAADLVKLGARFYLADQDCPNILFFHGNGEIAADYDDIGHIYNSLGMSFLAVDYRGYGLSEGIPTVSSMLMDAHTVFEHVCGWLDRNLKNNSLWIMGRSLGSASAIEIAATHKDDIAGLIIESGFAKTLPLLENIGVNTRALGLSHDQDPISNLSKMAVCAKPTLVIHAQNDHIIPLEHGQQLFKICPAVRKKFHMVPGANHNNIMAVGGKTYFHTINAFIRDVAS